MSIRSLCMTLPNPERVYRSGLRERPSALRGHCFTMVGPPVGWAEDPESYPETPDLWQCLYCYAILTGWQITERWLEPCTGRVRALPVGPPSPGPGLQWGETRLFAVLAAEADPTEGMGPSAKRTARARVAIANGRHPFGQPLLEPLDGETCGTCDNRVHVQHNSWTGWKCPLVGGVTRGEATDLRLWWPACRHYDPVPGP